MISHEYKCIFIHIPKCGGTSIEDVIWPMPRKTEDLWMGFINKIENKYQTGGLQHLKAWQIKKEVGHDIFDHYFKFSFVRNPWDKVISQYTYVQHRQDILNYMGLKKGDSLKQYLSAIQKKKHIQTEQQHKFIMNEDGDLLVDFLGRLEQFESDAQTIFNQLDIHIDQIPHSKKSARKPYSEHYDQESKEIVANIYARDIEIFDYTF